jgi:hypothetical protein
MVDVPEAGALVWEGASVDAEFGETPLAAEAWARAGMGDSAAVMTRASSMSAAAARRKENVVTLTYPYFG